VSVAEAAPSLAISKEPPVPAAPYFHQFAAFVAPDSADPIRHFLLQEWMEKYAEMFANKMDQRLMQLLREGWWTTALNLFLQTISVGIRPYVDTCTILVGALATMGYWEKALEAMSAFLALCFVPNALTLMMLESHDPITSSRSLHGDVGNSQRNLRLSSRRDWIKLHSLKSEVFFL
jgi:hypothetical protein